MLMEEERRGLDERERGGEMRWRPTGKWVPPVTQRANCHVRQNHLRNCSGSIFATVLEIRGGLYPVLRLRDVIQPGDELREAEQTYPETKLIGDEAHSPPIGEMVRAVTLARSRRSMSRQANQDYRFYS